MTVFSFSACSGYKTKPGDFKYTIDQFADVKVMRYQIPEWDSLSLAQKELLYYLSEAANCGRDIFYDQNFKYNLLIRHTLEAIERSYSGDRNSTSFHGFETYLKRIWFSNGIHHHYGNNKFVPEFSKSYFQNLMDSSDLSPVLALLQDASKNAQNENSDLLVLSIKNAKDLSTFLTPILFDPTLYAKKINLDATLGLIENSTVNYYQGVSTSEAENFYSNMAKNYIQENPNAVQKPISYGLNSKLIKRNGKIMEETYKVGGLYTKAIEKIVFWLQKAASVAENPAQKAHIEKLIEYYQNGDLKTWDEYNIMWVEDKNSVVDYNNGFIETYSDPLGMKASWEAIANFKNKEATKRTEIIGNNAQWFEDHSPVDPRFKKEKVKGITAKVITVAQLGGDCFPTPPIGINLPNADWIRRDHGSKSVTIENLTEAYDKSAEEGKSMLQEFAFDQAEIDLNKTYGSLGSNLHTDLHECLGHGSGKLLPNTSSEALKNYSSTLEEARADLFALYYLADPKLQELHLVPNNSVAKAEYNSYIRNGLMTQLVRIEPGKNLEEAHMRNRSLIAHWVYEKGLAEKVIEKISKNGKTYFKIHDYEKLRILFGKLLSEMQRIKSEGDYISGKNLVENYGVKVDPVLHKEVLSRYKTLNLAPYGGFVNPKLSPIIKNGRIQNVEVSYPDNFKKQMLEYGQKYSFLPLL